MVAIVATGLLVIPLTRWYLGMSAGTEDLQTKLMVQTIAKDKWDEIHAETFDDLAAALAANPSPWTEYVGDGNRWKIETTIGGEGKYVNAACADGTAGATDRKCRKVSIQVTDTMTGMTQAVNLAKVDSEYFNSRMKALENSLSATKSDLASFKSSANSSISSLGTRMTNAENKFGSYYTKTQTDSKINESVGGNFFSARLASNIWSSWGITTQDFYPNEASIRSVCTGSRPTSNYHFASDLYNSSLCSYVRAGYQVPSSCFSWGTSCWHDSENNTDVCDQDVPPGCNLICLGKKCLLN